MASTPPAKWRKVLPMCPVRSVTYVSGRSKKDDLKRRIDQAAKYVPLEQLCLSPQCGFASTEEGNDLTEAEEAAKLRLAGC